MGEHANASLMRRIMAQLARGELGRAAASFAPDVRWDDAGAPVMGPDNVVRALADLVAAGHGFIEVMATDWGAIEIAHQAPATIGFIGFQIVDDRVVRVHSSVS